MHTLSWIIKQIVESIQSPKNIPKILSTYRKEKKDEPFYDIRGTRVRNIDDLALVAQIWRDSRYETIRVVYVGDNKILAYESISGRLPGATLWWPGKPNNKDIQKGVNKIKDRIRRLHADHIYFVHNHPSGRVESSHQDRMSCAVFKQHFGQMYKGHLIIDHTKYNVISEYGDEIRKIKESDVPDYLIKEEEEILPPVGKKIGSPDELRSAVDIMPKEDENFDGIPVLISDAGNIVVLMGSIPRSWFNDKNIENIIGTIRKWARSCGGIQEPSYFTKDR